MSKTTSVKSTSNVAPNGVMAFIKANTAIAIIIGAGVVAALTIAGAVAFSGNSKSVANVNTNANKTSKSQAAINNDTVKPTTTDASTTPSTTTSSSSTSAGDVAVTSPTNIATTNLNQAPVSGAIVASVSAPVTNNTSDNGVTPAPVTPPVVTPPVVTPPVVTPPVVTPPAITPSTCPSSPVTSAILPDTSTTTTYDKARVTLTFDDGWKTIHDAGLPVLNKYCLLSTQYLNSQPITGQFADFMSFTNVKDFYTAGHELAWHTQTHADLTTLTPAQMDTELTVPSDFVAGLNAVGVPIQPASFLNFATPYGAYNAATTANPGTVPVVAPDGSVQAAILAKYGSHRSVDEGYNAKVAGTIVDGAANNQYALDVSNVRVQNILDATTPAQVQGWIDNAIATNTWLVIVFHEVKLDTAPTVEDYSVTPTNLDTELSYIKQSGIAVETMQTALTELKTQQ